MKEKIMNNFALKLLAAVLAVTVWLIVNNVDDPMTSKTFKNITVEIQNEQAITSLDKVYDIKSGGTINVTAYGKQSVIRNISASNIVATADLSQLSVTKSAKIQLSCPNYEGVTLSSDIEMLSINLEERAAKRCGVNVITFGTPADGHALGSIQKSKATIEVSGPESLVERVEEVRVEVNVEGVSEDFTARLEPKAYDAQDRVIESDNLTFGDSKIKVTVKINDTKVVPITVKPQGVPADGYHIISAKVNPATIEVTGEDEELEQCESISISYDVSGCNADVYEEVTVADQMPEGISVVDPEITTVTLLVTISRQELQTVKIPLKDIEIRNLGADLDLSFNGAEDSVEISAVWVSNEQTRSILSSDLTAYIDCKGLDVGTHTLEVQFVENGEVLIESTDTVKVNIKSVGKAETIENTREPKVTPEVTVKPEVTEAPTPNVNEDEDTDNEDPQES